MRIRIAVECAVLVLAFGSLAGAHVSRAGAAVTQAGAGIPPAAAQSHKEGLELAAALRFEEARVKLEAAVAAAPDFRIAHVDLAQVLRNMNDLGGARRELETALTLDSTDVSTVRLLAEVLMAIPDYPATVLALRQALALDSTRVQIYYALAMATEKASPEAEMGPQAIEAWRLALRKGPDAPWAYTAYMSVARLCLPLGRLDEALQACDQAIRLRPSSADAYYDKAVILDQSKLYREAIPVLEQAAALRSPNGPANFLLGSIYLEQQGEPEKALACFILAASDSAFAEKDRAAALAKKIRQGHSRTPLPPETVK
jgi:tetratricopeptide (TPR) repeat protein